MDVTVFDSFIPFSKPQYAPEDDIFVVTGRMPILSHYLVNYLEKHGIPLKIAQKLLRQVDVRNMDTGKTFIALGHRNEDGGYAIRSPRITTNTQPLSITFIRGELECRGIHIFKDDLDYLTALARFPGSRFRNDVIILNASCNLREAAAFIYGFGYCQLYTWLGNDKLGKRMTRACKSFCRREEALLHTPMNFMYSKFPDINTWHMHQIGKTKGGKR